MTTLLQSSDLVGANLLASELLLTPEGSPKLAPTPRDLNTLATWKSCNIELLEVRVSQLSAMRGQLAQNVTFPPNTRVACMVRNNEPILSLQNVFFQEGDLVYLVTDNEEAVRNQFIL